MNIWLVTIGEPIFHPANKLRLHRTGILAKYISEQTNHKVILWTSAFNHFTKQHFYNTDTTVDINPNLKMIAIHGQGYQRNISLDRIWDHRQIARKFQHLALKEVKPDVVVVAFPTLGLCKEVIAYAKRSGIPVLLDYRDMWPEVFVDLFPGGLKWFIKKLLFPLFRRTNKVFRGATGIIGITEDFLNSGLSKASRLKNSYDAVFPLAYLKNQFSDHEYVQAEQFWKSLNIVIKDGLIRICFFGTLGYQFDLDTIIDAATELEKQEISVQWVICGSGDKFVGLQKKSVELKTVFMPGYMNAAQISALLDISDIGLCPYYPNNAFLKSIPGKAIEYMSAGLPLLSTLENGILGQLVKKNDIGYHYESGNKSSLVQAIKRIIRESEKLKLIHETITRIYSNHFDARLVYKQYAEHLEKTALTFQPTLHEREK